MANSTQFFLLFSIYYPFKNWLETGWEGIISQIYLAAFSERCSWKQFEPPSRVWYRLRAACV